MNYDWFKVFNMDEFEGLGLVSKEYEVVLEDYGLKSIYVFKGDFVSVLFDDVFLTVNLNDRSPFAIDQRAVFMDDNLDVWVGVQVED